jgi:hypothetical protein
MPGYAANPLHRHGTKASVVKYAPTRPTACRWAPFPGAEDLGRGAIDAVFAVALAEQGRNQDAN